jgi:hypothetical protein
VPQRHFLKKNVALATKDRAVAANDNPHLVIKYYQMGISPQGLGISIAGHFFSLPQKPKAEASGGNGGQRR